MKVNISQVSNEALALTEDFSPQALDLETEIIRFESPIRVSAQVTRIANAVSVSLSFKAEMSSVCGRCLNRFEINYQKQIGLNYAVDSPNMIIDLDPDIREEIILDYPLKPLCRIDCLGLCAKCGKDLNQGKCNCK